MRLILGTEWIGKEAIIVTHLVNILCDFVDCIGSVRTIECEIDIYIACTQNLGLNRLEYVRRDGRRKSCPFYSLR